jgi:MraZ protein
VGESGALGKAVVCGGSVSREGDGQMPDEPNEPIYYSACYRHGVDEKRRVQIPAKWRPNEEGVQFTLILWPHNKQPDACLLVLPPSVFKELVAKITAMKFADPNAEALRRILGEKSDRVQLDKAGRFTLPDWMAKAVGIKEEALLNGMFDRFQIWSPDRYEATRSAVDARASEAFDLI